MQHHKKDSQQIKEDIKDFLSTRSFFDVSHIRDESMIFDESLIDSIGFVQLISYIEDTYGIKTKDKDLVEENFETVNAIATFISQKIA